MRSKVRDIGALMLVCTGVILGLFGVYALAVRGDWTTAAAAGGCYLILVGFLLGYHDGDPTRPGPDA